MNQWRSLALELCEDLDQSRELCAKKDQAIAMLMEEKGLLRKNVEHLANMLERGRKDEEGWLRKRLTALTDYNKKLKEIVDTKERQLIAANTMADILTDGLRAEKVLAEKLQEEVDSLRSRLHKDSDHGT